MSDRRRTNTKCPQEGVLLPPVAPAKDPFGLHFPTFMVIIGLGFVLWIIFSSYEFYDQRAHLNTRLDSIDTQLQLSVDEYRKIDQELYALGKQYNNLIGKPEVITPPAAQVPEPVVPKKRVYYHDQLNDQLSQSGM